MTNEPETDPGPDSLRGTVILVAALAIFAIAAWLSAYALLVARS